MTLRNAARTNLEGKMCMLKSDFLPKQPLFAPEKLLKSQITNSYLVSKDTLINLIGTTVAVAEGCGQC